MRDDLPIRFMLAAATLILGAQAALGVWFTWAEGVFVISDSGFTFVQGFLAFEGAVGLLVFSLLYCAGLIDDEQYVVASTLFAGVSLAASIWFWSAEVGKIEDHNLLIFLAVVPRIAAGPGWWLTIGSSAASLVCLAAFTFESRRANARREHHIQPEWRLEEA